MKCFVNWIPLHMHACSYTLNPDQRQGQEWERGDRGVAGQPGMREQRGYIWGILTFQLGYCDWGEEAVHMPAGFTYVTEKQFVFVCLFGCRIPFNRWTKRVVSNRLTT